MPGDTEARVVDQLFVDTIGMSANAVESDSRFPFGEFEGQDIESEKILEF